MRILYIFPHPDDESFGPAAHIHQLKQENHEVFLLTLTKGEATKQRFKYNLSKDEMAKVRYKEMQKVANTLKLDDLTVLDFPDHELSKLDPRILEQAVASHIKKVQPNIVISYAVHGISGFHDHLVTHAVVKRVYVELKDQNLSYLKRLALYTLLNHTESAFQEEGFSVTHTEKEDIDCIIKLNSADLEAMKEALNCYDTYQDKIQESGVIEKIGNKLYYEFFGESFNPAIDKLTKYIN